MPPDNPRNIPVRLNLILSGTIGAVFLVFFLILPLVTQNIWWLLAAALATIPLSTPYWSLIHEAIHNNLHPSRKLNNALARLMSISFGAAYGVLRFGHLMHHQYNREWESEFYDETRQNRFAAALGHYFKMLGGLYLIEVASSFALALAPSRFSEAVKPYLFEDERHAQAVSAALLKPKALHALRLDCLGIIGFYALSFALYGALWFIPLIALAGRAVIISIMDNAYHYDTPPDNSVAAKELAAPGPFQAFILNFNHHLTHHNDTALPWNRLPEAHKNQGNRYNQGLGRAIVAQFRGPLQNPLKK